MRATTRARPRTLLGARLYLDTRSGREDASTTAGPEHARCFLLDDAFPGLVRYSGLVVRSPRLLPPEASWMMAATAGYTPRRAQGNIVLVASKKVLLKLLRLSRRQISGPATRRGLWRAVL